MSKGRFSSSDWHSMRTVDDFFERLGSEEGPSLTSTLTEDRPWLDTFAACGGGLRGTALIECVDKVAAKIFPQQQCDPFIVLAGNNLSTALVILAAMRFRKTIAVLPSDTSDAVIERLRSQLGKSSQLIVAAHVSRGNMDTRLSAADCVHVARIEPKPPDDGLSDDRRPYLITFTSGSTGMPKGVVHPATTFINCALEFATVTGLAAGETFLNVMPMHYMAGIFNGLIAPLSSGCNVVISDQFSTATAMKFWRLVEDNSISALWLAPTMLAMVMKLDRSGSAQHRKDLRLFIGTGKLDPGLAQQALDRYGIVPVQSYGLSELLYVSVDDHVTFNFGSVGYVLPSVELILKDADQADLQGIATFDTPFAFLGYLDLDGGVSFPSDSSRVFETSDFVERSVASDGRILLRVKMRKDDIILRGGINIDPAEVEEMARGNFELCVSPGARSLGVEFCIVGVDDPMLGQAVSIVISGNLQFDREPRSVLMAINEVLPAGKKVDAMYHLPSLSKGPTGKLQRKKILSDLVSLGTRLA
jgi:long-chain acyl-CoA synthetase